MRDISTKFTGDSYSAAEFNSSQVELENIVTSAGLTLDPAGGPDNNQNQLGQAASAYACGGDVFGATGTVNDIVLAHTSLLKDPVAYVDKMRVTFKAAGANTGAVTVNVDSIGVKKVLDSDGNDLVAGDIPSGAHITLQYDTALESGSGAFVLLPPTPTSTVKVSYTLSSGTDGGSYTANTWGTTVFDNINRRPINTIDIDDIGGIPTPSSPTYELALPAGIYDYTLTLVSRGIGLSAVRILNVTDSVILDSQPTSFNAIDGQRSYTIYGRLSLAATKSLCVKMYGKVSPTPANQAMGEPVTITGVDEVYLDWILTRNNLLTPA